MDDISGNGVKKYRFLAMPLQKGLINKNGWNGLR
jgi:hypothetical protein